MAISSHSCFTTPDCTHVAIMRRFTHRPNHIGNEIRTQNTNTQNIKLIANGRIFILQR